MSAGTAPYHCYTEGEPDGDKMLAITLEGACSSTTGRHIKALKVINKFLTASCASTTYRRALACAVRPEKSAPARDVDDDAAESLPLLRSAIKPAVTKPTESLCAPHRVCVLKGILQSSSMVPITWLLVKGRSSSTVSRDSTW